MTDAEILALADRPFTAIEAGDLDGSAVEMPACTGATAGETSSGPRINRIDEYLDPAATAALVGTR